MKLWPRQVGGGGLRGPQGCHGGDDSTRLGGWSTSTCALSLGEGLRCSLPVGGLVYQGEEGGGWRSPGTLKPRELGQLLLCLWRA